MSNARELSQIATAIVVDSSKNVGIGTSSPAFKLHVGGTGSQYALVSTTGTTSTTGLLFGDADSNSVGRIEYVHADNGMYFFTNGTTKAVIDSSGNVGIGTASPTTKLEISGTTLSTRFTAGAGLSAAAPDYSFANDGSMGMFRLPNVLGFSIAGTERMRLDSSGNLNVGSTGFTNRIGAFVASGADRDIFQAAVVGVTNGFTIKYVNSTNSIAVRFDAIPTTASAANAFLDSADNNRIYRSTSSIRYKTNVENITKENSDAVLNLRPVWYRSLASEDKKDWSWYGLIAEEVAEIEPRLVHWSYLDSDYDVTKEDGKINKTLKADAKLVPDGVQYERVTVLLLDVVKRQEQAIQEQQAMIEELKAKVAALEAA